MEKLQCASLVALLLFAAGADGIEKAYGITPCVLIGVVILAVLLVTTMEAQP